MDVHGAAGRLAADKVEARLELLQILRSIEDEVVLPALDSLNLLWCMGKSTGGDIFVNQFSGMIKDERRATLAYDYSMDLVQDFM